MDLGGKIGLTAVRGEGMVSTDESGETSGLVGADSEKVESLRER